MSAIQSRAPAAGAAPGRDPRLYACPECGELPRGCICLRRSVRDRIADAIHFPGEGRERTPFLLLHPAPKLEPPVQDAPPPAA